MKEYIKPELQATSIYSGPMLNNFSYGNGAGETVNNEYNSGNTRLAKPIITDVWDDRNVLQ